MSLTEPHNEFLELCAVSTSGQLTEEEQKKLQEHLVVCQSCREILQQYENVVHRAIPAIAANEITDPAESGSSWSQEEAEKTFFNRLAQEKEQPGELPSQPNISSAPHRLPPFSSESAWRHVWMLYGAGVLLFASLSFYAYRVGVHRGTDSANSLSPHRLRKLSRRLKPNSATPDTNVN